MYTVGKERHDWLEAEAGRCGMTSSELLRRILDSLMHPPLKPKVPREKKEQANGVD
jgi:hypothetical protein